MKRLLIFALVIILIFSVSGCGGNSQPADSFSSDTDQSESEQTESSEKTGDGNGIISVQYKAYTDARAVFEDYVLDQSYDHEIVSVKFTIATASDLKNFTYLLPLMFMGESTKSVGKFDGNMEKTMLEGGWADSVELEYNEDTGYLITGTLDGSNLEIKTVYDEPTDSLRLEAYKDGALDLVFEYIKTRGGYAAQYYYKTITGFDKNTPIEGLCTFRTIFEGTDGSWARFDNVTSEPTSIYTHAPEGKAFIEGATHWFTIEDGSFTGSLDGEVF